MGGPPHLDVCDQLGSGASCSGEPCRPGLGCQGVRPNLFGKLLDELVSGLKVGTPDRVPGKRGGDAGQPGQRSAAVVASHVGNASGERRAGVLGVGQRDDPGPTECLDRVAVVGLDGEQLGPQSRPGGAVGEPWRHLVDGSFEREDAVFADQLRGGEGHGVGVAGGRGAELAGGVGGLAEGGGG